MSKYCPIIKERVIYQFCEDCTDRLCKIQKTKDTDRKEVTKTESKER